MNMSRLCNLLFLIAAINASSHSTCFSTGSYPRMQAPYRSTFNPSYPPNAVREADKDHMRLPLNREHCLYVAATCGYYCLAWHLLVPELVVTHDREGTITSIPWSGTVSPDSRGLNGEPVLHEAARGGQAKMVQLLLLRGATPDLQNKLGNTALHEAILSGHFDIACLLLSKGANPLVKNTDYKTPLDIAVENIQRSKADLDFIDDITMWTERRRHH